MYHTFIIKNPLSIHSPLLWHSVSTMRSVFFSPGSNRVFHVTLPVEITVHHVYVPTPVVQLLVLTLPTGTCPSNTIPDMIRRSRFVSGQCIVQGPSLCGPFRASSLLPSSGANCLSSILTVNITAAMNGSTVMCNNTNIGTCCVFHCFHDNHQNSKYAIYFYTCNLCKWLP